LFTQHRKHRTRHQIRAPHLHTIAKSRRVLG
jgi:hypothetical protein